MRSAATNLAKLGAAGAAVAAIAFAMLVLMPEGDVRTTRADVVDWEFFRTTPSQRFVEALDHLGHEEPRVYRLGQETVYFSARSTRRSPAELVDDYQRAFVEHGVNTTTHREPVSVIDPGARDVLRGEIVTLELTSDSMSMGGGVISGLPRTSEDLRRTVEANRDVRFGEVFRGFRHVEAARIDGVTVVTAVWSADGFDMDAAMDPGPPGDVVPACPGCRVQPTFETIANDLDNSVYRLVSAESPDAVQRFYRRAFADRGWVETTTSRHVRSGVSEYARGDERLWVVADARSDGFTDVTILRSGE